MIEEINRRKIGGKEEEEMGKGMVEEINRRRGGNGKRHG